LLAQKIFLSVIAYSREELLDIRATSTYQLYDQECDYPGADPLFGPPPRTVDLIPKADPNQWHAHCPPLQSILLANVQSLDNKVDEIRERVAFQRDIRDCNILCFTATWLSRDTLLESDQPPGFFMHHADSNKHLSVNRKGRVGGFMINDSWCNHENI
jgi:hypothetical protein